MENTSRLQVGIDISRNTVDITMLRKSGEIIETHRAFPNTNTGYMQIKAELLKVLREQKLERVDIGVEATSYYWLPLFLEIRQDEELAAYEPRLVVLNAKWVHWFKKSQSPGHKTDQIDPYYIAEYLRTMKGKSWWEIEERWLALRMRTRLRFHLSKSLTREKNYYQLLLFLSYASYNQIKPFSDTFGCLSQQLLGNQEMFEELCQQPEHQIAAELDKISHHQLKDPQEIAARLKRVYQESYRLTPMLETPVREALYNLSRVIKGLQIQLRQVDQQIKNVVKEGYPEVNWLKSVPGVGLVFGSGIAAEIGGVERFFSEPKWDQKQQCYRKRNLRDAEDAVAKYAGLWWPQSASGQSVAEELHMSKRGNAYLRYYLLEAVDRMRLSIPSYRDYYAQKYAQANKHHHKRALVLVGRKSIGLFVGLLHRKECYRPEVDKLNIAHHQPPRSRK